MILLRMWFKSLRQRISLSLRDIKNKDHIKAIRLDEAKIDALLHYPIKPAAIPLVSVEALYQRHKSKIIQIEQNIGLVKTGNKYNSTAMVEDVIKKFISYCHLFPASEMDHHQYIGGLLEHSLDVSIRSLQSAIGSMLDEQGLIDEDQLRRPRYEYAAWLCGLLHDAGKIISNLIIIEPNTGKRWQPLHSSLIDWSQRESFTEYTVLHNKNRIHNEHETNSIHFLSLILNETTKDYLLSGPDDLYSKVTQTLIGYHSNNGYLHNAVRLADGASTYNDYARVWMHDSHRDKSMVAAVVDVLRSLYFEWSVNTSTAEMFVLNGEIYLDMNKPFRDIISKCQELKIGVPNSPKSLIEILIEKRIISKVSDKSTFGNLYFGKFTNEDVHQFIEHKTGPLSSCSPKSVIKFSWGNFAIGENPMPDNTTGALRYNSKKADNTFSLFNKDKFDLIYKKTVETSDDDEEDKSAVEQNIETFKDTVEAITLPEPTKISHKTEKTKQVVKPTDTKPSNNQNDKTAEANKTKVKKTRKKEIEVPADNAANNKSDETTKVENNNLAKEGTQNRAKQGSSCKEASGKDKTPSLDVPTWVTKRPIKLIDTVLWGLSLSKSTKYLKLESDFIIVSVKYLAEQTKQTQIQVVQEMEYLGLSSETINIIPKRVEIDDVKTRVLALSTVVAIAFSYLQKANDEDNKNHTPSQDFEPATSQVIAKPKHKVKKATPIQQNKESNDNTHRELPTESSTELVIFKEFVESLQTSFPSVTMSSLRPYLQSLKIKPYMTDSGALMIETTQVQRDELNYKIQQGITDVK